MRHGPSLTAFDIDALTDESDHRLIRQATEPGHCIIFSLLKPSPTVLISLARGSFHTCFPLFNIRSLKTISVVVYLNMYNPLIVILCFLGWGVSSAHIARFILCVLYFVYYVYFIYSTCITGCGYHTE